ncbi:MAG TPA: hypothetical protein VL426_06460 [Candidatus Binatia bacterium]|nr:hypothetical protein [Candidatus Binatia bacterium]
MARAPRTDKRTVRFRTAVIFVIIAVLGVFAYLRMSDRDKAPDQRMELAQCLTDKGAKFYGAYWCPHCAAQKKLFGKALSKVTYIECAIPGDSTAQTQACKDAGITGYPTWVFADGSRLNGEVSLVDLAEKTGCPYPGASDANANADANVNAAPQKLETGGTTIKAENGNVNAPPPGPRIDTNGSR